MQQIRRIVIILLASFALTNNALAVARFSRANCVNNESITWDPWTGNDFWRFVLSDHIDLSQPDPDGKTYPYKMHRQGSGTFLGCTPSTCYWTFVNQKRVAVVDFGEGLEQVPPVISPFPGVPTNMYVPTKQWVVIGRHDQWAPGWNFIQQRYTGTDDCGGNILEILLSCFGIGI